MARYQLGQYFYATSPLVVVTYVLLTCKPLLPTGRECLSYISILSQEEKNGDATRYVEKSGEACHPNRLALGYFGMDYLHDEG